MEDSILDCVYEGLVKGGFENVEQVPGCVYIDTEDGSYAVSVIKCEDQEDE